ncbi:MAG: NEAT domain-containing protein [Lysinibacillus sp.]
MANNHNTKIALAALMAASVITPAAVSANAGEAQTVNGTDATAKEAAVRTIDFTVTDETGMLARVIKGPGELVEQNGQQYIKINLSDTMLSMLTAITVEGESALHEIGGKKVVLIPVDADYAPVEGVFTVDSPMAKGDYKATLTPDAKSIKEAGKEKPEEKPTEETPAKPATPYGDIADGKYEVTFDAYDPKTGKGDYTAITNQLEKKATLVVEDGKYFLEVSGTEKSNGMITEYQVLVDGKYVKAETVSGSLTKYPHVVRLPLTSLNDLTTAKLHVAVPNVIDKWYDFQIAVDKGLDLPEKEEAADETVMLPAYVYQDGSNVLSIMHGKYLADTVEVTATEAGYDVDVTFPEGQHLNGFSVEGATVAKKSEKVDGSNTVKVYTVSVDDLSKIYTATVDLSVRFGDFAYDEKYDVQLQFGGKKNPFTDIQKLANYGAIVSLYSDGIFKENEKFNPYNTTTRYQFSLMLYRALDIEVPATTNFKDIAKLDEEALSAIKALNNIGVINGINKETFAPYNKITRAQTAKMIYRLLVQAGYEPAAGAKMPFGDVPSTDKELNEAAAQLNALGIMTGSKGKLNPGGLLTRDQMAKVLNNTLEVLESL